MAENNYYLAIDQGGGSTRAIIFDSRSEVISQACQQVNTEHPRVGWVEQDAEELLESVKKVLQDVAARLNSAFSRVAAVALATQRSNVVCWKKSDGKPLSSVISWQDRRASQWMNRFDKHRHLIRQKTGLVLSPHYGVSKIKWCLEHLEEVKKANRHNDLACGPLASFLAYNLLKNPRHLVDPANASRTLLWNIHNSEWDQELLQLFDIEEKNLPECLATSEHYGDIEFANHAVPLTVVTGDQSAALYAYGIPEPDTAYINMGTGVFIQHPTGGQIVDIPGLLCSMVFSDESRKEYVVESTINGASNALMEVEEAVQISGEEAERNLCAWFEKFRDPPLFLNGVAGLAAPYWIPDFPSRFVGAGSAEEKILAVAESILFLIKVNIRLMLKSGRNIKFIRVTGGLSNSDCLCQKLADLLQLPVIREKQTEATAMGLAFLAAGSPASWNPVSEEQRFVPMSDNKFQARFNDWESAMNEVLFDYRKE